MTTQVRSVTQAFAILRLLAESSPLTLSDIGRSLALSPSSCLNLLRTLVDEGAIARDGKTKSYRLTPDWATVDVFRSDQSAGAIQRIQPTIAQFAKNFGATVSLWRVVPGHRLRLCAHAESDAPMRIQLADGQRQPLGGGATGRALAAEQDVDDNELARRFKAVRWQKPMPIQQYIREIRQARDCGFAIDDGAAFAGICTVAVALTGALAGYCLAASVFSGSRSETDVVLLGQALATLKV